MREDRQDVSGQADGSGVHVWTYCLGRVHMRIIDGDDVDVRCVVAKMPKT